MRRLLLLLVSVCLVCNRQTLTHQREVLSNRVTRPVMAEGQEWEWTARCCRERSVRFHRTLVSATITAMAATRAFVEKPWPARVNLGEGASVTVSAPVLCYAGLRVAEMTNRSSFGLSLGCSAPGHSHTQEQRVVAAPAAALYHLAKTRKVVAAGPVRWATTHGACRILQSRCCASYLYKCHDRY